MPEWLRLKGLGRAESAVSARGFHFDLVLSPYDVPEAVRGFQIAGGRFRIEFRYIDGPEPKAEPVRLDEFVTVTEGRFTGRPMALEVCVEALGAESVGLSIHTPSPSKWAERVRERLDSALDTVAARHSEPQEKHAYESAKAALKTREEDLLVQLSQS